MQQVPQFHQHPVSKLSGQEEAIYHFVMLTQPNLQFVPPQRIRRPAACYF
jgi:hypothetical protein